MGLRDMFGVLFGHLLDVDAAHVAENQDRELATAVPGDAHVVLLGNGALGLDEDRARLLALDHDRQDGRKVFTGFVGGVGELHRTGLHAPAREYLTLQHHGATDVMRGGNRLFGGGDDTAFAHGQAVASEQFLGFVFVKTHSKPFRLALRTDGVFQGSGRYREREWLGAANDRFHARDGPNLMASWTVGQAAGALRGVG